MQDNIKIGDYVMILGSIYEFGHGMVVGQVVGNDWWEILTARGVVHWPGEMLEVMRESR